MAQSPPAADSETTRTAEEVVRGAFDAVARRDAQGTRAFYSPELVEELVPIGVFRGADAMVAFWEELFAAIPDIETTVTRLVPGEREVAAEWRMSGTFTGAPFQGIEPTGRRVEMRGFDLFEVEDGRIVANTAYYDGMAFARQVGMMPPQDSGAEKALKSAFNAVTKLRQTINERRGS